VQLGKAPQAFWDVESRRPKFSNKLLAHVQPPSETVIRRLAQIGFEFFMCLVSPQLQSDVDPNVIKLRQRVAELYKTADKRHEHIVPCSPWRCQPAMFEPMGSVLERLSVGSKPASNLNEAQESNLHKARRLITGSHPRPDFSFRYGTARTPQKGSTMIRDNQEVTMCPPNFVTQLTEAGARQRV
jgi:hypothetical protein